MNMKKIIFLIVIILFVLTGCGQKGINKKLEKFTESRFLFGTYIQMIVYAENEKTAKDSMNEAFNRIAEIDSRYNSKSKGSLIYNLNNSENKEITLDEEGIKLFEEVKKVYEMSHGKYDITISPLLETWGFFSDGRENVPSEAELKEALTYVDFQKVELKGNTLKVNKPVKELDTGSFLKGYAVEEGKKVLAEKGIEYGFISSISSISTIGGKGDGTPWKVGIQNPDKSDELMGVVEIAGKALGVSGDYQTYIEINGEKYHHIMDKTTGYPVKDKKMVVVICDSAFMADMYSTAFFNMEIKEIFEIAERENLEVMIVDKMNNVQTTKSFLLK